MKQLSKTKGIYFYRVNWYGRDDSWVPESEGWDGQWYFEVFDNNQNKVGYAAFVGSENENYISPCDFTDIAIEIDENHRRCGIASSIIAEVQKIAGKPLKQRSDESTPEGSALMDKLNIPFDF